MGNNYLCSECGASLAMDRSLNGRTARYCSNACRQRAYRKRRSNAPDKVNCHQAAETGAIRSIYSDVFVGRANEIASLNSLLARHSVVTVLGLTGTGKTRLAAEYIGRAHGRFSTIYKTDFGAPGNGSIDQTPNLFDLTSISGGEFSLVKIDRGLHSSDAQKVLVWLDSCERKLDVCERLVAHFLSMSCKETTLLLTSREAVPVPSGAILRLGPLPVPPGVPESVAKVLTDSAAVRLFTERAHKAERTFRLNRGNLDDVIGICKRVEGNPLAIELAARWVRLLSVGDILRGLADPSTFLLAESGSSTPGGFAEALDHTHGQLHMVSARVSRRLSVFPEGFSADAATAVCCDEETDEPAVLEALSELESRALLVRTVAADAVQFQQPGPVRMVEFQHLEEAGEVDFVYDRLVRRLVRIAEPFSGPVFPSDDDVAVLAQESATLHRALEWALERTDHRAQALAPAAARWLLEKGRSHEGQDALHRALAVPGPDSPFRASAVWSIALNAFLHGDYVVALRRALDAAEMERSLKRPARLLLSMGLAVVSHVELGQMAAAAGLAGEASSVLTELDHDFTEWAPAALVFTEALIYAGEVEAAEETLCRYRERASAAPVEQPADNRARADMLAAQIALAQDDVLRAQDLLLSALKRKGGHLLRARMGYGLMIVSARRGFYYQALILAEFLKRWRVTTRIRPLGWWQQRFDSAFAESIAECDGDEIIRASRIADEISKEELVEWITGYLSIGTPGEAGKAARLTPRELEVAGMLLAGLTNYQMARHMGISHRTIETHLDNIRKKAGVRTRAQMSVWVFSYLKGAESSPHFAADNRRFTGA